LKISPKPLLSETTADASRQVAPRTTKKDRKKGVENRDRKIPPEDWPSIAARAEANESLASIGRSYGCSAPAIRYILKKHGLKKQAEAAAKVRAGVLSSAFRDKVTREIALFVVALEAAMAEASRPNLLALRDATGQLLRASSRMHIEVEDALQKGDTPGSGG